MISKFKKNTKKHLPFAVPILRTAVTFVKHRSSKKVVSRLLKERSELFVELGSGDKKGKDGWVTIDMTKNCDIFWDLRKGLPFPDESLQGIYSSHFFEHLTYKETQQFLVECKRALVPGGEFLICVPNAKLYLEAYVGGRTLELSKYFGYKPAYNHTTRIDYVNYMAYMDGEHKYMFDEENLLWILESKGFKNVRLRQFDPSLDRKERDYESIYAAAER
jgi:predicted SAM-dependent methyltransferase